ncbi:MAG: DUF975 family protein [Patescibacteria group bacterium]|nr:DUF975 family protein [Patescibacteria group bacterium]
MPKNAEITKKARESLSGRWWFAVGVLLLYYLITGGIANIPMATLIVGGPFVLGLTTFSLSFVRKEKKNELAQLFEGFKNFENSLVAYLLVLVFTLLWMLLFIIPGIIASISYSQTFYILADEKLTGKEAIEKSKKMMMGYKWKYFCLNLRFFGWTLLSLLSLGIGFIFLIPYIQMSQAIFYEELKANYKA